MTTIVLGGLMGAFAKLIGLKMENPADAHHQTIISSIVVRKK